MRERSLNIENILVMGDSIVPMTAMILMLLLALLAPPALAEQSFTLGEIPDEEFKPWKTMHPGAYKATNKSAVDQCYDSIGTVEGLLDRHCETLANKLEAKECAVTMVEDGTRYRYMRGRVNGDPAQESRLTPNLEKQLGREDRALRCDLGDGIIVDWFTGDEGKSCNNLGFLYQEPPPEMTCFDVPFDGTNQPHTRDHLYTSGVFLPPDFYVGGVQVIFDENIQSKGSARVCVSKENQSN